MKRKKTHRQTDKCNDIIMVRPSPVCHYIHCTSKVELIYIVQHPRDIFSRPHEETSAFSGTTCIIIAESAKEMHLSGRMPEVHDATCLISKAFFHLLFSLLT